MTDYEYCYTGTEKFADNTGEQEGLEEAIDQERQTNGRHHHPYPRHHSTLYSTAYPKLEQPLARL